MNTDANKSKRCTREGRNNYDCHGKAVNRTTDSAKLLQTIRVTPNITNDF